MGLMHNSLSAEEYHEIVQKLAPNGALRDLLVLETSMDDWQRLIDFIGTQTTKITYAENGKTLPPRTSAVDYFRSEVERPSRSMRFQIAGMDFHCHFFEVDRIEIDIDPRQIVGRLALDSLLDFMFSLGRRLGKDVLLSDEGAISVGYALWEEVICSYEAASGKLRLGCQPHPLVPSPSEMAAIETRRRWTRAFWARFRLIVKGWGEGLDIVGAGASREIGLVQLWVLTSDDDIFVVAGIPIIGRPEERSVIGSVGIDASTTDPAQAAQQTALELKHKILEALGRL